MDLVVRGIEKRFGAEQVLRGVDLTVAARTTLSILGVSGGGKTTLLKIIAGLVDPDAGSILLGDTDITTMPPQKREIIYLYQEPLLFPHLNVYENVAFGLELRKRTEDVVRRETDAMLEELSLDSMRSKMPHQLSGGQRQRVAFGRALVVNPRLLLLDEPFSSLDPEIRASMQQLFKKTAERHGITAIFVTHSLKESLIMGDGIAHLRAGVLRTYPSKEEFIRDPDSGVGDEVRFWESLRATQEQHRPHIAHTHGGDARGNERRQKQDDADADERP